MRSLLLAAACLSLGLASAQTPTPSPAVPAVPPGQARNAAGTLQVGQIWLLEGKTDQGRAFRAELVLRPLSAEERRDIEEPLRQSAGATRITAVVGGTPTGAGEPYILAVATAAQRTFVTVLPNPSVDALVANAEAGADDELAFCFLLADSGERSFSGLSLRLREEGESYSATVAGTVGSEGDEREQTLSILRASYAPLFGVGECSLTRR